MFFWIPTIVVGHNKVAILVQCGLYSENTQLLQRNPSQKMPFKTGLVNERVKSQGTLFYFAKKNSV